MGNRPNERNAASALMQWYADAGVDEAIGEAPRDRYAESRTTRPDEPSATPKPQARADAPTPKPLRANHELAHSARQIADACNTLDELRRAYEAFDGCPLKETATNFVFADGNPEAPLMLIGEAPGREEDRRGLPFVGPAGKLLDAMLAAIGRNRETAYITNILPWRPPGNRNPTDSETALCLPFVERHIRLANPRVLVFVGGTAAKTLLGTREGIMRLRGRWHNYKLHNPESSIPARAIFHPAYLLRTPAQKGAAWRDLLAIRDHLEEARKAG